MKQNEKIFKSRANKLAKKYIANFNGDGFLDARNKLHCQILRDEYDFDATIEKMEWVWDKIKSDNLELLREFVAYAKEISDNCEDSVVQIIGEFITDDIK